MPFIHVRYSTPAERDLRQPIARFLAGDQKDIKQAA